MAAKQDYIAVFDSGVGGISVLRELLALMPRERYLYFGDIANAPYGGKTTRQVRELTLAAADMLMGRNVKALVVACNTATAAAITDLRQRYPDRIIVGIEPAVKLAADRCGGRVGIMATEVTLREEKLASLVERFPHMQTVPVSVPKLVPLIEADASEEALTAYLEPILAPYAGQLDAVVLGCTHYPFASGAIWKILGEKIQLLDGGRGTALQTMRRLEQADLLYEGPGQVQIENSAGSREFTTRAMALLEKEKENGI